MLPNGTVPSVRAFRGRPAIRHVTAALLVVLVLVACGTDAPASAPDAGGSDQPADGLAQVGQPELVSGSVQVLTTAGGGDGNRYAPGALTEAGPSVLVSLGDGPPPAWVIAAGDELFVVDAGGGVHVASSADEPVELERVGSLPAGQPPVLVTAVDGWRLVPPPDDLAAATHPVHLADGTRAYVARDGSVVVGDVRLDLDALPDARPVTDGDVLLVLVGATDRYGHGVLGDAIEASALAVIRVGPDGPEVDEIPVASEDVIEGIAPVLADADGDGDRDAILTVSSAADGARIEIVDLASGDRLAGAPIGTGARWRHVIGVMPVAGDKPEIVEVVTPHLARVATWNRVQGQQLRARAEVGGELTTHVLGSRNLDQGALVDVDGDGMAELLGFDGDSLVALKRRGNRADVHIRLDLGSPLATNLSATAVDGQTRLAFGTEDGRIWLWR